jgi:hypothetical protein
MSEKVFAENVSNVEVDYDETIESKTESKKEVVPDATEEGTLYMVEARDLLQFFMRRFYEVHGYQYKADWIKESAIMKSFKLRYGPDAGLIVKSLFDDYGGKWNEQVVGVTVFAKGSKWIQDQIYFRLQKTRQMRKVATKQGEMLSSGDFLTRFQS